MIFLRGKCQLRLSCWHWLGGSPTSILYFRPCAAQNTMLVIFVALCYFCCAMAHFFSPERFFPLRLSMLRQRIWSYATYTHRRTVGGHTRSRSCVMPSIIIGVNILNWYGAVIAQSGRQFDESRDCFFMDDVL